MHEERVTKQASCGGHCSITRTRYCGRLKWRFFHALPYRNVLFFNFFAFRINALFLILHDSPRTGPSSLPAPNLVRRDRKRVVPPASFNVLVHFPEEQKSSLAHTSHCTCEVHLFAPLHVDNLASAGTAHANAIKSTMQNGSFILGLGGTGDETEAGFSVNLAGRSGRTIRQRSLKKTFGCQRKSQSRPGPEEHPPSCPSDHTEPERQLGSLDTSGLGHTCTSAALQKPVCAAVVAKALWKGPGYKLDTKQPGSNGPITT